MALIDKLPPFYANSPPVVELQNALDAIVEAAREAQEDATQQLFISTATWGLDYWEKALGIVTDRTQPLEKRRGRVLAKSLAAKTTTKETIKAIAEAFTGDTATVTENTRDYWIEMTYASGEPVNHQEINEEIDIVKPAHLTLVEPVSHYSLFYKAGIYGLVFYGGAD